VEYDNEPQKDKLRVVPGTIARPGWGERSVKKPTPFGKYFLLERINIGGMAEVFRAKAFGVEGFERLVAVKRILSNVAEDKEFIRMFIEEAKLSVQLNHANIAQIFDLGVVDGAYYIALEHVHGRDLRGIFDRGRQLGEAMPVAQACFVAMKVCEGLDYAHNKRDQSGKELALVHRDVSPQNILVSFEGEVKLIDFGIAKAAGTVTTQGGILKGKFGYMSPEQVRGLPVDRRSDVFSCGIVLYELLTGERLFVGESDFSTLEKVRNVEILPPSTYNRKIPDELERIVLKALSKDVDDRYQNAIDLHDELQAFVYTAGEFYSRKDLAGWMKKTFDKEIEEESARLESYRQLRPPAPGEPIPQVPRTTTAMKPAAKRKATQPVPVAKPPPPPPPVSRSQPVPVLPISASIPAQPPSQPPASVPARAAASISDKVVRPHKPVASSWDDDEIETRIYDNDGDDSRRKPSARSSLPLQPPVSSSPAIALIADDAEAPGASPELASLAPNGAGWGADAASALPSAMPGSGPVNGVGAAPATFPSGSSNAPPPLPPDPMFDPLARSNAGAMSGGRELSGPQRLVSGAAPAVVPPLDPMATFGARITSRRTANGRGILMMVIGGAAVVAITVIVVILVSGGSRPVLRPAQPSTGSTKTMQAAPADPDTGFDLYVTPAGVTQWKLDGDTRTDRLPSRIRGIAAGPHTVQIDPPPGFLSQHQQVTVELGKAPKVEITLQPITGITGVFDSTPPGAMVSLIIDGKRQTIGPSPATAPLDPRSSYHVLFEKPGYVSVNRPIAFSGGLEERVVANLEKASPEPMGAEKPVTSDPKPSDPRPSDPRPSDPRPSRKVPRSTPEKSTPEKSAPEKSAPEKSAPEKSAPDPDGSPSDKAEKSPEGKSGADAAEPKTKGQGVLVLGSKPPCDITIDGSATGLHTPQTDLKLSVGRHRIMLTNSEFGIKETFTVDIKAETPEKIIKDYSDRLPN
jgi:eukaryotic-like serine/threonine-protein kinase